MTWQFPENQLERLEAMMAYINQLKAEVEQLKKQQPPTPENLLGSFGGGGLTTDHTQLPFDPSIPCCSGDGGGGGGDPAGRVMLLGKTGSSVTKGSSVTVTIWEYSGGSHTIDATATGGTVTAYSMFGSVGSGKYVWCSEDIETSIWYITAAECS